MILSSYYDVIRSPIITEKSTILGEAGKYVFEIHPSCNKFDVKKAVEKIFSVKVKKVNIISIEGKVKRFRGFLGKKSDIKKAIVTLESGSTIDFAGGF